MVKKAAKSWVYTGSAPTTAKMLTALKAEVTERANGLIEEWKPKYVKEPPPDNDLNYIVDLYSKWYRDYFYLCAKYASPSATAITPHFEAKFARLEHVGNKRFNLAFMRYTGEWIETEQELTLEQCLEIIENDDFYKP